LLDKVLDSLAGHVSSVTCALLVLLAFLAFSVVLFNNVLYFGLNLDLFGPEVENRNRRNNLNFFNKRHLKDLLLDGLTDDL
jgi:hypothetical protein